MRRKCIHGLERGFLVFKIEESKKIVDKHMILVYYNDSTVIRIKSSYNVYRQVKGGVCLRYENDRPIYLQVIEDISRRLIQGELALGEKLPSVRELAVQYQINPNTASRVYKEMESQGLCYTRRGMGTFITEDSGMIKTLQKEMAENCLDTFLQGMQAIGISLDEMIQLLRERYAKEDL